MCTPTFSCCLLVPHFALPVVLQATSLQHLRQLQLNLLPAQAITDSINSVSRLTALTSLLLQGSFEFLPNALTALGGQLRDLFLSSFSRTGFDASSVTAFSRLTALQLHGGASPSFDGPAFPLRWSMCCLR